MYQFKKFSSHPVILLPNSYPVFDLSSGIDTAAAEQTSYGIGKYNEKRLNMYRTAIFDGDRNIHMGVDIFAPSNTEVYSFGEGKIFLFGNNSAPGDYGYTLITEHLFGDKKIYALYGHLSQKSISDKKIGQNIKTGEIIAWIGNPSENGGWTPHLHFQLSFEKPSAPDLPGVVSDKDHEEALRKFPDPRIVLGPIYI